MFNDNKSRETYLFRIERVQKNQKTNLTPVVCKVLDCDNPFVIIK